MSHLYPLPQPPLKESQMPKGFEPILMSNPAIFRINDITIGVNNFDGISDMARSLIRKGPKD